MTTVKRIKAMYYGDPYHIGVLEKIPAKEIRETVYPRLSQNGFVREAKIHRHTVRSVESNTSDYHLSSLVEFLKPFNLKLVIYKDGKYFTDNLNLFDLVALDQSIVIKYLCEDVGVHENYFSERRENFRVSLFRDIVDYLGYNLAIVCERGLG